MERRRNPLILGGAVLFLCLVTVFFRTSTSRQAVSFGGEGLFSWEASALLEEREDLFVRMEQLGLTEVYQSIPDYADKEEVESFLDAAQARGFSVYLLTGDPSWGLDESGEAMLTEVARAESYNQDRQSGARLRGIVMDAEPYLTEEWEEDADGVMERYVSAMKEARSAAENKNLVFAACIPWFYDDCGQEQGLAKLAEEGCDALVVMNYDKENEGENLKNEAALAETFKRPLVTVYELQQPGTHDLTEKNTYWNDGIAAVEQNFSGLTEEIGLDAFYYALHDYEALKEVMDR